MVLELIHEKILRLTRMERLIRRYNPPERSHILLLPFIEAMDIEGLKHQLRKTSALDDLTVRELRVVAGQNGILNYSRFSKEELIGVIHAARESGSLVGEDEATSPQVGITGNQLREITDICERLCRTT